MSNESMHKQITQSIHKNSNYVCGCGKGGAGFEIINDYDMNTPHW
jgi:hypothetical protein